MKEQMVKEMAEFVLSCLDVCKDENPTSEDCETCIAEFYDSRILVLIKSKLEDLMNEL